MWSQQGYSQQLSTGYGYGQQQGAGGGGGQSSNLLATLQHQLQQQQQRPYGGDSQLPQLSQQQAQALLNQLGPDQQAQFSLLQASMLQQQQQQQQQRPSPQPAYSPDLPAYGGASSAAGGTATSSLLAALQHLQPGQSSSASFPSAPSRNVLPNLPAGLQTQLAALQSQPGANIQNLLAMIQSAQSSAAPPAVDSQRERGDSSYRASGSRSAPVSRGVSSANVQPPRPSTVGGGFSHFPRRAAGQEDENSPRAPHNFPSGPYPPRTSSTGPSQRGSYQQSPHQPQRQDYSHHSSQQPSGRQAYQPRLQGSGPQGGPQSGPRDYRGPNRAEPPILRDGRGLSYGRTHRDTPRDNQRETPRDYSREGPRDYRGPDRAPPKRRSPPPAKARAKSPPRADTTRERNSQRDKERIREKRYHCKFPQFCFSTELRDYPELRRRYPMMYLSGDFTKAISTWIHTVVLEDSTPQYPTGHVILDAAVPFLIGPDQIIDYDAYSQVLTHKSPEPETGEGPRIRYHVRVMLLSGSPYTALDQEPEVLGGAHFSHLASGLQFLMLKKDRTKTQAIGGPVDSALDGDADPGLEESVLINAAIRHTKEQTSLDLSPCSQWIRVLDICYARKDIETTDITVFYMPNVWDIVPDEESFAEQWREREALRLQSARDLELAKLISLRSEEQDKLEKHRATLQASVPTPAAAPGSPATDSSTTAPPAAGEEAPAPPQPDSIAQELEARIAAFAGKIQEKQKELPNVEMAAKPASHLYVAARHEKNQSYSLKLVSLDLLQDYDYQRDRAEETFEVSLFAEQFNEMLCRCFGYQILLAVRSSPPKVSLPEPTSVSTPTTVAPTPAPQGEAPTEANEKKRPREEAEGELATETEEPASKKPKLGESAEAPEEPTVISQSSEAMEVVPASETPQLTTQEPSSIETEAPSTSDATPVVEEAPKLERRVLPSLLRAFHYFDKSRVGFLRSEDLEALFLNLGLSLPRHYALSLLAAVDEEGPTSLQERKILRVDYKRLVEIETLAAPEVETVK